MVKKFCTTPRELIMSDKDYSSFSKDDLIIQHEIIMKQYDDFKNQLKNASVLDTKSIINPKILAIRSNQIKIEQVMFDNIIKEIDSHLKIIEDLIESM
jgi:hypothetical protein